MNQYERSERPMRSAGGRTSPAMPTIHLLVHTGRGIGTPFPVTAHVERLKEMVIVNLNATSTARTLDLSF